MTPKQQELLAAVRELQRTGAALRAARDRVNELLREVCEEPPTLAHTGRSATG